MLNEGGGGGLDGGASPNTSIAEGSTAFGGCFGGLGFCVVVACADLGPVGMGRPPIPPPRLFIIPEGSPGPGRPIGNRLLPLEAPRPVIGPDIPRSLGMQDDGPGMEVLPVVPRSRGSPVLLACSCAYWREKKRRMSVSTGSNTEYKTPLVPAIIHRLAN